MKKQTILTLGICALAFGAVAGAVSAQAAKRVDAASIEFVKVLYTNDSWATKTDLALTAESEGVYSAEIDLKSGAQLTAHYKWDDGNDTWCDYKVVDVASEGWWPAKGGEGKGNASYSGTDAKFKVTVKNLGWNSEKGCGQATFSFEKVVAEVQYDVTEWIVTNGVKAESALTPIKVDKGADIPGYKPTVYGLQFDGWFIDEACTTPAGKVTANATVYGKVTTAETETYHFDVSDVSALATPYYHTWDGNYVDKAAWPGEKVGTVTDGKFDLTLPVTADGVIITDGAASETKQTVDIKDLDTKVTYKISATVDDKGHYTYSTSGSSDPVDPDPTPDPEPDAKFGISDIYFTNNEGWENVYAYAWDGETKNAEWPGVKLTEIAKNEYSQGIFKVTGMTAYSKLVFTAGNEGPQTVDIVPSDLKGEGDNAFYLGEKADSKFTVGSWKYAPSEDPDPVYTCTVAGNPVKLVEVAPGEYDGATCVKKFRVTITATDGAVVVFSKDGTPIAPGAAGNIALVEDALKITKGGAGISLELKVYEDGGFATWASEPADADLAAVREFVEKYIATPAAEDYKGIAEADRKATCATKYDTAKTELAKLSPAQQALFNTEDEFIDARATLAIWEAAKGSIDGAMSVNSSKGKSTTAIVVASVVAVGAISAGAMLFFSRKRKANK